MNASVVFKRLYKVIILCLMSIDYESFDPESYRGYHCQTVTIHSI